MTLTLSMVSHLGKSHTDAALSGGWLLALWASLCRERHDLARCEWQRNRWQPFFLSASDAEVCSCSVTLCDPALLTSSSSRGAHLHHDKGCQWARARMVSTEEPSRSRLDECFLMGCCQRPPPTLVPLLSRSSYELTILWHAPPFVSHLSFCFSYSHIRWRRWRKRIRAPASSERVCGHTSMPAHSYRMEGEGEPSVQAVQSHICTLWMRLLGGWTSSFSASLDGCAPGLQTKMLANEEAGLDSPSLRDLRSSTDLVLSATKATAQAIGRSMSSLIVLERHLWLMMKEMKEADKVPFLDAPISSGSLFGPAVEGFAERFTEAQKSSQAMRHFLPKCTSSFSASSRPRPAPTQQTAN